MYSQAIDIARHLMGVSTNYNPLSLCEQLDIPVTTDRELNKDAYICPGLGDAGDRIFGTK